MPKMRNQNAGRDLPDVRLPGEPDEEEDKEQNNVGKDQVLNCKSKGKIG